MRASVTRERIERLMDRLGRAASVSARVYLVGGASAVMVGWRLATIDVDLAMRPHDDALLRAIPAAKEELDINVELASRFHSAAGGMGRSQSAHRKTAAGVIPPL